MKAAILKAKGQPLTLEDIPEPTPGAGEALVRVLAAPVLTYAQEVFTGQRNYPLVLPLAPGCGAIGLVEKTGPDATRLQPGQLVFCDPMVRPRDDSDSPANSMLQGWVARGEGSQKLQSYFRHGPFAEKMLIPLENATALERMHTIDPVKLSWLVALLVPYAGLLAANLQPGQIAMINGATGYFGSAGVAVALALGAECVVAPGRNQEKLNALVNLFGARVRPVLLTEDETLNAKRIAQAAEGPIDCLLDLLGQTYDPAPTRRGILSLRPGGIAVFMGGVHADIPIPYDYVMHNNLVIRGQYMCPQYAPLRMAALIRSGLLPLDSFSIHTFPLSDVNQAIHYAHNHAAPFHMTVLTP